MFVSPSFRRITVLMARFPKVGKPPKPCPEMLLTSIFHRQRHIIVMMRARREVDVDANVLVVE